MNSITKRWLTGSLLITLIALILAEAVFLVANRQSYYSGVEQAILSRFSSISGQLKMNVGPTAAATAQARSLALRRMVEQFDAKDKFEFMLLDADGGLIATSSGYLPADGEGDWSAELDAAVEAGGTARRIYTSAAGEQVLAITMLTPYAAEDVAALRMSTSLELVDDALSQNAWISLALIAVILGFSLWSGLFFVRSIVNPLGQVENIAARIARGDLSARLPETDNKNDEIGRLCTTINQMAEDLSKTEKLKNDFISSVSHELRTPLTSIRGWVETIAQIRDPEDENYRKGIAIIGRETDRLYDMVEELLDFSRMQNGIKMELTPLDLVAELTDAALFVEARIKQQGLRLVYEEPDLPLPILGDAGRLRQVFINVLDNAIKYSSPGGAITLDLLDDGENAYVIIRDEGRGIAPDDLENVKLKFFKGKGAVRGSGIGLAVVDEIITAMDGAVDITSELGKGTAVKIRLPLYIPGRARPDP